MPVLLFVSAHPDDELYAAGLLAALSKRRVEIDLVCLTRGEGGSLGQPPVATRAQLGATREAELRASAAALGIGSVEMLGYIDPEPSGNPRVARAPNIDSADLALEIMDAIRESGPDAILTHGSNGEYGHPAHRLVHLAVLQGSTWSQVKGFSPVLYTFNAAAPGVSLWGGVNPDDPADLVFDATPWLDAKIRAFESHASQRHIWLRPGGPATTEEYVRGNAFQETYRRIGPARGDDPLRKWLSWP